MQEKQQSQNYIGVEPFNIGADRTSDAKPFRNASEDPFGLLSLGPYSGFGTGSKLVAALGDAMRAGLDTGKQAISSLGDLPKSGVSEALKNVLNSAARSWMSAGLNAGNVGVPKINSILNTVSPAVKMDAQNFGVPKINSILDTATSGIGAQEFGVPKLDFTLDAAADALSPSKVDFAGKIKKVGDAVNPPQEDNDDEQAAQNRLSFEDALAEMNDTGNNLNVTWGQGGLRGGTKTTRPFDKKNNGESTIDREELWKQLGNKPEDFETAIQGDLAKRKYDMATAGESDYKWTDIDTDIFNDYIETRNSVPELAPFGYENLADFQLNGSLDDWFDYVQYANSLYGRYGNADIFGDDGLTIDYDLFNDWYNKRKIANDLGKAITDEGTFSYEPFNYSVYGDYENLEQIMNLMTLYGLKPEDAETAAKSIWGSGLVGREMWPSEEKLERAHKAMGDEVDMGTYSEGGDYNMKGRLPGIEWDPIWNESNLLDTKKQLIEGLNNPESAIYKSVWDPDGDGKLNLTEDDLEKYIALGEWIQGWGYGSEKAPKK